jgi:hypothetical protein
MGCGKAAVRADSMIDVDDLPGVAVIDGARVRFASLREGGNPPNPPGGSAGWVRNKIPECMYGGLGSWLCMLCCRSGWDLRYLMCGFREVG